jgi:general secretion pathway protein A
MDYFSILQLEKEPFSNSPDPTFFFKSRQHQDCLQKVELALRLKRGLNVVMGDVGTGKTTLCRQLIRRFQADEQVDTHLILDPAFDTPKAFLKTVAELLSQEECDPTADAWELKEIIKKSLFKKGVDEECTIILIFDEGQKLPSFVIELLREFLNYETNTHKLLQIAIFAQCEFETTLKDHANFADRVNLLHRLAPMSFRDTRELIRYRLKQSSASPKPLPLFTLPAMWAIYRSTRGYPRRIINLCHQSLLAMIIQNRTKASLMLVRSCVRRAIGHPGRRHWRPLTSLLLVLLIAVAISTLLPEPYSPVSHLASALQRRPWLSVHPVDRAMPSSSSQVATGVRQESATLEANSGSPTITSHEAGAALDDLLVGDAPFMEEPMAVPPPDPMVPQNVPPEGADTVPAPTGSRAPARTDPARSVDEKATGAVQTAAAATGRPLLLGRLKVASGDTLVRLVRRIRGNYDPKYLDSLLALNPHIKDPDDIAIADEILFPATPVKVSPLIDRTFWLQLDESALLHQAYDFLTKCRDTGMTVQLVPYWTATEGLRFVVLAAGAFPSSEAVRLKMSALPADLSARSRIRSRSHWGRAPVFYASPF